MRTALFLIIFTINLGFSQTKKQVKADTLFIANKKIVLTKTKVHNNRIQNGPVILPSEYMRVENKREFNYKIWSRAEFETEMDEEGIQITTCRYTNAKKDSLYTKSHPLYTLRDTVIIDAKRLGQLIPYINNKNKKFCAANILALKNDTITKYIHSYMPTGEIFGYWNEYGELSSDEIASRKATTFILQDLYYRKGQTTFFLDIDIVVITK
jgi:hypothetical protein